MSATAPWKRLGRLPSGSLPRPAVWALPPVAALAATAVNLFHGDPAATAETNFLALSLGLALGVIAALGDGQQVPDRGVWLALGVVTVVWLVYHGPRRGALVGAMLLLAMGWTAFDAARRCDRSEHGWLVPAAFGIQILARSELLLLPLLDGRKLVSLVALPVAAGLALGELARQHGRGPALLAGAAVAVLAPGWNVATTLTLVAMALAARLSPWSGEGPEGGQGTGQEEERGSSVGRSGNALLGAAWLVPLLVLPLWKPIEGTLIAAAAMSLALGSRLPWLGPLVALAVALGAPRALAGSGVPTLAPSEALQRWLGGMVLLPMALLTPASTRWRQRQGIVFLLAAVWAVQGADRPEAMAPGLVLLALAVPRRGAMLGVQSAWSVSVLGGTTLLAAYPWGRASPREDWLALLGIEDGSRIILPFVLLLGLGTLSDLLVTSFGVRRIRHPRALGAVVVLGVLALALGASTGPALVLVDHYGAVTLSEARPVTRHPLAAEPVSRVVVDTHLVHGADLPLGTGVAWVLLRDGDGEELHRWPLRVGRDTAEWAAGRADVAARPGFVAPPPWITTIAPGGQFVGHRFRRRLELATPVEAAEVVIERDSDLPAPVALVVYRLELRR